ncbi:unnamed protein product [Closterium sp. NIES-65]|nr:unnamed protein product [Closterium sp. NIES-65]
MAPRRASRPALQAGLAAILAAAALIAAVFLLPSAEASASVVYDSVVAFKGPMRTTDNASLIFYNALCDDVDRSVFANGSKVSAEIAWDGFERADHKCSSISFHSAPGCAGRPYMTYLRPPWNITHVPTTWMLSAADLPASARCEEGCAADCGSAARCIVRNRKDECVCPGSLVFDVKARRCLDGPASINEDSMAARDPCTAITCPSNAFCAVKNGTGSCKCSPGYVKKNGLCTAVCKPTCPRNAECAVVAGTPMSAQSFKLAAWGVRQFSKNEAEGAPAKGQIR